MEKEKKSVGVRNMELRKSTEEKSCEKRELEIKLKILLIQCKSQRTLKGRCHASEAFDKVFKF